MGCIQLDILEKSFSKFEVIRKNSVASKTRIVDFLTTKKGVVDYYPFGMLARNGEVDDTKYRYGFQGQEEDNEVKGDGSGKRNGNSVNYKYRMHDPRLGRFFAVDPLAPDYPHNSPYAFSENRVIDGVELEGLEFLDYRSTMIGLRGSAIIWNANNVSTALKNAHTTTHSYKKWDNWGWTYETKNYTVTDLTMSSDVVSYDFLKDKLQFKGNGMIQSNSSSLGQSNTINVTPRINNGLGRFDMRFNPKIISGASPKSNAKAFAVYYAVLGATYAYQSWAISSDIETAKEQSVFLDKSIDIVNEHKEYIPDIFLKSQFADEYVSAIANYLFDGTYNLLFAKNRDLYYIDGEGDKMLFSNQRVGELIEMVGKNIWNNYSENNLEVENNSCSEDNCNP